MSFDAKLTVIRRASARAEARMRLGRALWALPTALTLALAAAGIALAVRKVWPAVMPESWALAVLIGAGLSVIATVLATWLRSLPPLAGALALDRHHGLRGRLTNALEFVGEREPTPMMSAAIEDACEVAASLEPRRAVALAFPQELVVSAAVASLVFVVALLEVPTKIIAPPVTPVAAFEPLDLAPDDLELFKDALEALERDQQSPEVKEAIERFNQLVTDIAERRLDRTEAFRKMEEIESDLLAGAEADKKALDEALKDTAKELDKSAMSKPIADALAKNDLQKAAEESKKLAEKLRTEKPSQAELERLRKALERAASNKQKALEEVNEQRAALKKDLLEKKQKDEAPKDKKDEEQEKRLLQKKKRELERLDREAEQKERALRKLSKLDRDLAKAAADLMRDLGASAEDMEQIAEDINRLEQEQMSDDEKEELRRRLQEMRDIIRQQGQGGQKMKQRLQRFQRRAKGGKGGQGKQGEGDQPGGHKPGQDGKGQDGQDGEGQGDGKGPGQGQGKFTIGPGGQKIPIDMPGSAGHRSGPGSGDGDKPGGEGSEPGGKQYGSGSGGDPKGKETDMAGQNVDVRADAVDTGQGPSNAEVILSAAERGFTGKPYKQVFKQYQTVAEDQIDKEQIPDGMRFYVRRYFQLIRPRE